MLWKVLLIIAILLLMWCVIGVDEMDTRTYQLKNSIEELSAKHNKLVNITRKIYESSINPKE